MSTLQRINDHFDCIPGTEFELSEDGQTCRCLKGVVYVHTPGALAVAVTKDSKVVGLVDGAKLKQEVVEAKVLAATEGVEIEHAAKKEKPVKTGASRGSSCSRQDLSQLTKSGWNPLE